MDWGLVWPGQFYLLGLILWRRQCGQTFSDPLAAVDQWGYPLGLPPVSGLRRRTGPAAEGGGWLYFYAPAPASLLCQPGSGRPGSTALGSSGGSKTTEEPRYRRTTFYLYGLSLSNQTKLRVTRGNTKGCLLIEPILCHRTPEPRMSQLFQISFS